ncbi:MAG: PQQ-binding-like beta-propeller repeat protein [Clostridia bacterium]|jgi:outer membrane protein assembly factor BamB|nr:PQQ-binding-like beta-propeller repeat protein [Clostridia bacterium]MDH7573496.1 PQQ-binding-like beta-propeller repeat protein [Clostridia bacterium]
MPISLGALNVGKKTLVIFLALLLVALVAATPALAADWPQFQKDAKNSGIYTGAALPTGSTATVTSVQTEYGSFFGIDSTPIYVTTNDTGYVYVFPFQKLYEYYTSGNSLVAGSTPLTVDTGGFQLCTPASDGNSIFLGVNTHLNQTQNKDFTTSLDGWTTGSSAGSPEFSQTTVSGKTCARIHENDPSTDGDGYIQQTVYVPSNSNVRIAFSYLQQYTGSPPSQRLIKVQVKRPSDSTWNTALTITPTAYDTWVPVNENISTTYFPNSGVNYDIRFVFDYTTSASSTATCCFTDCQVIAQSMGVEKVTGLGTGALSLNSNFCNLAQSGQANTPLKYYQNATGSYLLLGKWTGSTGGKYFCIDANTGQVKWEYTGGSPKGYYWAGAACVDDVAIFGDEDGKVHVVKLEPDQDGNAIEVDQDTNTPGVQAYDLTQSNEPIRSSICYYDNATGNDYLYLTSADGYLYQLEYNPTTQRIVGAVTPVQPQNYCTSTPVRYGDWVYVGMGRIYGGSGLWAVPVSGGGFGRPVELVSEDPNDLNLRIIQSSPVVYPASDTEIYIYVTENNQGGRAVCVKHYYDEEEEQWKSEGRWTYTSQNYVLQGFAAADGKLFYGDDSGYLYYVH